MTQTPNIKYLQVSCSFSDLAMSQLITPPETPQEHHNAPAPSKASPLSRFFFLETVFAILLSALLIVGGLMGASTMVKEGNPDINFAIATIQTN